jgi:hypothetical protein
MEGHQLVAQRAASGVPGGTNTEDIEAHNTNTKAPARGRTGQTPMFYQGVACAVIS